MTAPQSKRISTTMANLEEFDLLRGSMLTGPRETSSSRPSTTDVHSEKGSSDPDDDSVSDDVDGFHSYAYVSSIDDFSTSDSSGSHGLLVDVLADSIILRELRYIVENKPPLIQSAVRWHPDRRAPFDRRLRPIHMAWPRRAHPHRNHHTLCRRSIGSLWTAKHWTVSFRLHHDWERALRHGTAHECLPGRHDLDRDRRRYRRAGRPRCSGRDRSSKEQRPLRWSHGVDNIATCALDIVCADDRTRVDLALDWSAGGKLVFHWLRTYRCVLLATTQKVSVLSPGAGSQN